LTGDQPKTALVTGATGFTGTALTLELCRRGYRVRALVRDAKRAEDLEKQGVEIVVGDITDPQAVDRAVDGRTHVYHVAAVFRTTGHPDSYYHDVHVGGTENLLAAARKHATQRIVHISTVGVHGHVRDIPGDENSPYNPGDIYQTTKLDGERVAQRAMAEGQPWSVVRPAGIYGPGDMRFLKLFKTIHRRSFRMFGSGEVPYHFTFINDLVNGIILCGEHPDAVGEIFIIGGREYVSLNRLVEMIAESVAVRPPKGHLPVWPLMFAATLCEILCRPLRIDPPLHRRRCAFFTKSRAFRIDKAVTRLGFDPKMSLIDGMQETAEWYFEQGLLKRA